MNRLLSAFFIVLLTVTCAWAGGQFQYPKFQAIDSNGEPLEGGKLYTYISGTTTNKATYSDYTFTTANSNPVILDSRGEATIYGTGIYKFLLKDSSDTTIWTVDPVYAARRTDTIYQQEVVVAKAGGDYDSIQDAIDSITDATANKRYAVTVLPGDYAEAVTMKDYVDIIGCGRTNSRITGTSGTLLTFPTNKATIQDMGIYADYGALGATTSAVVSGCADAIMLSCDITVTKSSGDYVMHSISITGGSFRMWDSYHLYSITGATTDTQLTQSAIVQSGALTAFLLNSSEIVMTSNDTNDDLVGFETTTGGAGTYLLSNNVINVNSGAAGTSATGLWVYGTATGATVAQNRITVNCNASAYGIWIDSTAGGATVNTRHNEIIVTAVGAAVSCNAEAGDTWNSVFDKITAASGYSGAGTITFASSDIDGTMAMTGDMTIGGNTFVTGNVLETTTATACGTGAQTLSAAELLGGFIDDDPEGNATWTTDTAANIVAAITDCVVGTTFRCVLFNDATGASGEVVTVAGGAGVTMHGTTLTMTEGTNITMELIFRLTNVTAAAEAVDCYVLTSQ